MDQTAEQVIRYAIDGTLLGRRGEGGVYQCSGGDDEWVAIDRGRDPMTPADLQRAIQRLPILSRTPEGLLIARLIPSP